MDKKSEALLRKLLKNWVNRQRPPENGRARLLWEAAHTSPGKNNTDLFLFRPQYRSHPSSSSSDWTLTLFTWINEYSFQVGLKPRLI